jgi:protein-disulfide isomerase
MEKSRRQARLDRRKEDQRKNQIRWLIYIVIGAVAVTALMVFANRPNAPIERTYTQKDGNLLGSADAPVTLVEYADFQCIHCYNFYNNTEHAMIDAYVSTGQVLYEVRFVNFLGPESAASAEATYCAADQNMFWEYHDFVFANYSSNNVGGYSEARLTTFAETLGLDMEAFSSCLESGEKAAVLEANLEAAQIDGVTGTPSLVLNGRLLEGGALSFEALSAALDAALGQ